MDQIARTPTERFDHLFSAFYAAVLAYGMRRATRIVAEEVASETFLVAWRRLDVVPDEPLPWLLGVARRVLANQRRSEQRSQALVARLGASLTTRGDASRHGVDPLGEDLTDALAALSLREREAVLLIAWEGLTQAEAATAAGCSPTTFRVRLYRARKALRAFMARQPADDAVHGSPVSCISPTTETSSK